MDKDNDDYLKGVRGPITSALPETSLFEAGTDGSFTPCAETFACRCIP